MHRACLSRGAFLVMFVVVLASAFGCSSKAHHENAGAESEGETVVVPECLDYAHALHTCFEKTGVPATNALAAADANARAPLSLSTAARDARAHSCAQARALLATTCR